MTAPAHSRHSNAANPDPNLYPVRGTILLEKEGYCVDDEVVIQQDIGQATAIAGTGAISRFPNGDARTFARLLEQLRETRSLTKADLAKRAGVDPSTITRFEQGSRAPERDTVMQLADAMVLPASERDTLLAAAGFRSSVWDDPQLVELVQLMSDPEIPSRARDEARSVLRMAISHLKLQRLQDS